MDFSTIADVCTNPVSESSGELIGLPPVLLLGLLCAVLLGLCGYVVVLRPLRRRAPLLRAIPLLASDERDALRRAEALLNDALAAGLRRHDLADARFALSFVRAMLGRHDPAKYQQAATSIGELRATGCHDADSAYLDLWLQGRLRDHDVVIELHEKHGVRMAHHPHASSIASMSYLHKAIEHWRRREIDGALHYFELVRDLGVLQDRIPGELVDLQIAHGVQALFDGRLAEARRSFADASERAQSQGESTTKARLGLIVYDWKVNHAGNVDAELGHLLDEISGQAEEKRDDAEHTLLLGHVALLHVVSLLKSWLGNLPAGKGLPLAAHEVFWGRVQKAGVSDPELGDVMLVHGLIDYYFASKETERDRAIDVLGRSTSTGKGVTLPEVLDLVARSRQRGAREGDPVNSYLALVRTYLNDPALPVGLRTEMQRKARQFAQYQELDNGVDLVAGEHVPSSIEEIVYRGNVLLARARPYEGQMGKLLASFEHARAGFVGGIEQLRRVEHELILNLGEFLLREDTTEGDVADA